MPSYFTSGLAKFKLYLVSFWEIVALFNTLFAKTEGTVKYSNFGDN